MKNLSLENRLVLPFEWACGISQSELIRTPVRAERRKEEIPPELAEVLQRPMFLVFPDTKDFQDPLTIVQFIHSQLDWTCRSRSMKGGQIHLEELEDLSQNLHPFLQQCPRRRTASEEDGTWWVWAAEVQLCLQLVWWRRAFWSGSGCYWLIRKRMHLVYRMGGLGYKAQNLKEAVPLNAITGKNRQQKGLLWIEGWSG